MLTSQLVVTKSGTEMLRTAFKRSKYVICGGMDFKIADNYVERSTSRGGLWTWCRAICLDGISVFMLQGVGGFP
jgi:hypothetical protein